MLALDHTRHSGIFDVQYESVILVGAGGIGAITAVALAKMGVGWLEVWDGDTIEDVNVATQFHSAALLGENKATALGPLIQEMAPGIRYHPRGSNVEPGDVLRGTIIISALDSINARKMLWDDVLFHEQSRWQWYLDARMGAEEFQLISVDRNSNWDWYDAFINRWNEDDIPELPCTEKATIYTANGAAAFIGSTVRRISSGLDVPKIQSVNFREGTIANV